MRKFGRGIECPKRSRRGSIEQQCEDVKQDREACMISMISSQLTDDLHSESVLSKGITKVNSPFVDAFFPCKASPRSRPRSTASWLRHPLFNKARIALHFSSFDKV